MTEPPFGDLHIRTQSRPQLICWWVPRATPARCRSSTPAWATARPVPDTGAPTGQQRPTNPHKALTPVWQPAGERRSQREGASLRRSAQAACRDQLPGLPAGQGQGVGLQAGSRDPQEEALGLVQSCHPSLWPATVRAATQSPAHSFDRSAVVLGRDAQDPGLPALVVISFSS